VLIINEKEVIVVYTITTTLFKLPNYFRYHMF